ncbi:hypothetical protein [Alienimonas californiensis]|uniref:hypothetical protein n=1 Tax=Alienimonas californiensis TaxID=2527989 RepID=UPI0011A700AA|nr:hypothetical protein [Alienimonas californiensis]
MWLLSAAAPLSWAQEPYRPAPLAPGNDLPVLELPEAGAPAPRGFAEEYPVQEYPRQEYPLQEYPVDRYSDEEYAPGGAPYSPGTPLPAPPGDESVPGFPEPPEFGQARVPGPPRPAVEALPGTPFFADTEYGARPNYGDPGAPAFGLPHQMEQSNRYGIWYRPKSFHAPNRAVYRPSPFRPRGFGNLFDRPCVPDRMDYTPYTVEDLPSRYGPTYYPHFRENTECLVRPTRHYDKGPHAENSTGGCRLGADCYHAAGMGDCPGCRPHGFLHAAKAAAAEPAAGHCQCERCQAKRR